MNREETGQGTEQKLSRKRLYGSNSDSNFWNYKFRRCHFSRGSFFHQWSAPAKTITCLHLKSGFEETSRLDPDCNLQGESFGHINTLSRPQPFGDLSFRCFPFKYLEFSCPNINKQYWRDRRTKAHKPHKMRRRNSTFFVLTFSLFPLRRRGKQIWLDSEANTQNETYNLHHLPH